MAVQSSARLSIAATASFYDWQNPDNRGLLKGFDEKNVITERRRVIVGDIAGSRRPMNFIGRESLPVPSSRHEMTLRLRRLERKVLFWKSIWSVLTGLARLDTWALRHKGQLR